MARHLLTLVIVGALSILVTVEAKPSNDESVKTGQLKKSSTKSKTTTAKNSVAKPTQKDSSQQSKTIEPISQTKSSLGNTRSSLINQPLLNTSAGDRYGITNLESFGSDSMLNKKLSSLSSFDNRAWDSNGKSLEYSIDPDDVDEDVYDFDNEYPISSKLSYSLLEKDEKPSSLPIIGWLKKTFSKTNAPTSYGIKTSSTPASLTASNFRSKGSLEQKNSLASIAMPFNSFTSNNTKPLANISFGTGYELNSVDSQIGFQADEPLDPSSPTKGVSADIPLAGGSFNIGVSYIVGRLNGIYRDKSDFTDRYAEFVDDKYGLFSLNLSYSHPIGKQTTWYGSAGYTAGNKLYHNSEGFSNLFGGPSSSTNGYAVHIGVKHSF
ncbi:MAG: hypothetical protein LUC43_09605 [Burkholderiales bacterium]|nr:hypothetical protein [Burkholderiales bacterium]